MGCGSSDAKPHLDPVTKFDLVDFIFDESRSTPSQIISDNGRKVMNVWKGGNGPPSYDGYGWGCTLLQPPLTADIKTAKVTLKVHVQTPGLGSNGCYLGITPADHDITGGRAACGESSTFVYRCRDGDKRVGGKWIRGFNKRRRQYQEGEEITLEYRRDQRALYVSDASGLCGGSPLTTDLPTGKVLHFFADTCSTNQGWTIVSGSAVHGGGKDNTKSSLNDFIFDTSRSSGHQHITVDRRTVTNRSGRGDADSFGCTLLNPPLSAEVKAAKVTLKVHVRTGGRWGSNGCYVGITPADHDIKGGKAACGASSTFVYRCRDGDKRVGGKWIKFNGRSPYQEGEEITLEYKRDERALYISDKSGICGGGPLTTALPTDRTLWFFADTCSDGQGWTILSGSLGCDVQTATEENPNNEMPSNAMPSSEMQAVQNFVFDVSRSTPWQTINNNERTLMNAWKGGRGPSGDGYGWGCALLKPPLTADVKTAKVTLKVHLQTPGLGSNGCYLGITPADHDITGGRAACGERSTFVYRCRDGDKRIGGKWIRGFNRRGRQYQEGEEITLEYKRDEHALYVYDASGLCGGGPLTTDLPTGKVLHFFADTCSTNQGWTILSGSLVRDDGEENPNEDMPSNEIQEEPLQNFLFNTERFTPSQTITNHRHTVMNVWKGGRGPPSFDGYGWGCTLLEPPLTTDIRVAKVTLRVHVQTPGLGSNGCYLGITPADHDVAGGRAACGESSTFVYRCRDGDKRIGGKWIRGFNRRGQYQEGEEITLEYKRDERALYVYDASGLCGGGPLTTDLPTGKVLYFFADTCSTNQGWTIVSGSAVHGGSQDNVPGSSRKIPDGEHDVFDMGYSTRHHNIRNNRLTVRNVSEKGDADCWACTLLNPPLIQDIKTAKITLKVHVRPGGRWGSNGCYVGITPADHNIAGGRAACGESSTFVYRCRDGDKRIGGKWIKFHRRGQYQEGDEITLEYKRDERALFVYDASGLCGGGPITTSLPTEKVLFFCVDTCSDGQGWTIVSSSFLR